MKRLYSCAPPRPVYQAGAVAFSCFDARFELPARKFLRRLAGEWVDHLRLAGGAKSLASPGNDAERDFILAQVRASIRLHDPARAILIAHADCGAYGGVEAFDNDEQRERDFHRAELARAARLLREVFPALPVSCYFIDFEGAWEWEQTAVGPAGGF